MMTGISDGKWIIDFDAMTCRRVGYGVVVSIEKTGDSFRGKIQDMPVELMEKWACDPDGEWKLKEMVVEAEAVFTSAYNVKPQSSCPE
jgi:hypothetical protein